MPRADPESPRRVDDSDCPHQLLEISERFSHSHEDDIVDLLSAGAFHRDDLIYNLVCAQIARESFQAARAKFATVRAAYLRRDADCPGVRFGAVKCWRSRDQNRFNQISIG